MNRSPDPSSDRPLLSFRAFGVVVGGLVCQMGLGYGYAVSALAGEILSDLDWTRTMYSGAMAPQLFVIALFSPLVGTATIRYGSRRVLAGSAAILGVSFLLLSGLESLWQLYGLVILMGFAVAGLGDISVSQAVSQWFPRGRGLALGIVFTGSNIGGALLVWMASSLSETASWRTAFFVMGVGALVVLLPAALLLIRNAPQPVPQDDDPESTPEAAMRNRDVVRTRSFWILAFSLFTFFFYFMALLQHLVLFLTDHGMPDGEARDWFRNAILLGFVSKIILGLLASFLPARTTILIDYALIAVSSIALLFLPDPNWLVFFILTYGFATAARDVVYPLIVTHCFGLASMASVYGLLMLALLPGGTLGPLFASAVYDGTGNYVIAFQVFCVLNLVALASLAFVKDERPT